MAAVNTTATPARVDRIRFCYPCCWVQGHSADFLFLAIADEHSGGQLYISTSGRSKWVFLQVSLVPRSLGIRFLRTYHQVGASRSFVTTIVFNLILSFRYNLSSQSQEFESLVHFSFRI